MHAAAQGAVPVAALLLERGAAVDAAQLPGGPGASSGSRGPSPDISCSTRERPYTVCSDQVYRFNRFGYAG